MGLYDDMPPEKLEELRRMIEELDFISEIDDDTRELIETKWPWLISSSHLRGHQVDATVSCTVDGREIPGGFKVSDSTGQTVSWVYARDTENDARIAKVLTWDEARRIASNWEAAGLAESE